MRLSETQPLRNKSSRNIKTALHQGLVDLYVSKQKPWNSGICKWALGTICYLSEFHFPYMLNEMIGPTNIFLTLKLRASFFSLLFLECEIPEYTCVCGSFCAFKCVCVISNHVWVCFLSASPHGSRRLPVCVHSHSFASHPLGCPPFPSLQLCEMHEHFSVMRCSQQADGAK